LDLPRAPLPDASVPAPVRLLPTWDATLLVHCRRARILPEEYRPLVFSTKVPHSVGTILVDGSVAGSWRAEASGARAVLSYAPFERMASGHDVASGGQERLRDGARGDVIGALDERVVRGRCRHRCKPATGR
jgi:hypothetical protein